MNFFGQQRDCYICGKRHDVYRLADLEWRGLGSFTTRVFLCSHACQEKLKASTKADTGVADTWAFLVDGL